MKVTVKHNCGHIVAHQIHLSAEARTKRIDWLRTTTCADCAKSARAAAVATTEANDKLPALTGSDKQIAWARTLRIEMIAKAEKTAADWVAANKAKGVDTSATEAQIVIAMAKLTAQTSATFWIDSRDLSGRQLLVAVK